MATSPTFSTSNQYIKYRIVVTENSTSIPYNNSVVNVKVQAWRTNQGYTTDASGACYCTVDGEAYGYSWSYGQKPISYNSYTTLFEITVAVPHNSDGKKTMYVSAYISHSKFSSSSQGFNVTLTDIPRKAEITSAPNFTDVDNPAIVYSNPAGTAVTTLQACISLDGTTDTIAYRDIDKSETNYTFALSAADRTALLNATPNSKTLTVYFIIKTVLSGTTYYSSVSKTMTVVNADPTISGVTYKDTNATTLAVTSDDQKIVRALSTVDFGIASIAALKGATLASVAITVNAVTVTDSLSGSSVANKTVTFGTIDSSVDETATIVVTDSRGFTATETVSVTMLAWSLPTAIITCKRKSNFYSETDLTVNASYDSLDGTNVLSLSYQYKEKSAGTYGAAVTISDGVTYTLTLDNTKEWDVKVIVADLLGSTTYNLSVYIGIPALFVDNKRRSVGVNAIPDQDNMFVADRRIALNNLQNERVSDIWSFSSGTHRSATFYLYDETGTSLMRLRGETTGATQIFKDKAGTIQIYEFAAAKGGCIYIYNSSGNQVALLATGAGNSDGIMYLKDHSGNDTIWGTGESGDFWCTTLHQTSSRKVKKNIVEMALDEARKILKLVAVKFDFKDEAKGKDKSGFIAEDVAEILPNLVSENKDGIDYIGMIAYLQAVIKDHEERIEALENKLNGGN